MSARERFERILASLNDTVLDDSLWPHTFKLIDEACGSKGNMLVFSRSMPQHDVDIRLARFCFQGHRREDWEREYFEVYHPVDERIPRLGKLPDSKIVHVSSLYSEEEKKRSVVYNEALPCAHSTNSLNVRLDGPEGSSIVVALANPVAGRWSSADFETIARLLPRLRQCVLIRQALVDARALGASLQALLENTRLGVILLDRGVGIVAANAPARAVLRRGDGLTDTGGRLRARAPGDDEVLQRRFADAMPPLGVQATGGSLIVSGGSASARLVVHVSPLRDPVAPLRPGRVAALALVVDPARQAPVDPELAAAALGLTPAESQIAVLLAEGRGIDDIAAATWRGAGTVRWHLKRIFTKHGLSRQTELVRLVLSLADLGDPQR